ncbi:MAG: thiol peroxidase [Bacteroides sp.]|nr:thiol peroxidase [Bacteroides sp.]MCM1085128.1 thiol peroxidase [Bacteroides sp.]MCM1169900.1 thiol peroxidase [Bacteroides sp.]
MEERTGVVTMMGNALTLCGPEIKVGAVAPDFTVLNASLQPVKLSDFKGQVKVISTIPSIDTGVCAMQTRRFNQEAANLNGVAILTISCDLPFALGRFCGAEGIDKVQTLSDHMATEFGLKYGFLLKELRLLNRGIIVIDRNDKVVYVEYVKENTELPDFDAALAAVKAAL